MDHKKQKIEFEEDAMCGRCEEHRNVARLYEKRVIQPCVKIGYMERKLFICKDCLMEAINFFNKCSTCAKDNIMDEMERETCNDCKEWLEE